MRLRRLSAALLLLGASTFAEEVPPETLGRIQAEQRQAEQDIAASHGNRKPSEMDREERRQVMEEQKKANNAVLEKYGVSAKDYAHASSRLSREDRAQVEASEKRAAAEKRAEQGKAAGAPGEVAIEYGKGAEAGKGDKGKGKGKGESSPSKSKSKSSHSKRSGKGKGRDLGGLDE